MMSSATHSLIKTLLAERRYSNRAIAKITGVTRRTVDNVAHGRGPRRYADQAPDTVEAESRCSTCGAKLVEVPCRSCTLRASQGAACGKLR